MNTTTPKQKPGPEKIFPAVTMSALLAASLFSSGCASIISEDTYFIPVDSVPSGANLTVTDKDGKYWFQGTTPTTVGLRSGAGYFTPGRYTFSLTKTGYETRYWTMESDLDVAYLGNLIFGGLLGLLIIDPLTGAMWEFPENRITKELTPEISRTTLEQPITSTQNATLSWEKPTTPPPFPENPPIAAPAPTAPPPKQAPRAEPIPETSPLYVPLESEEVTPSQPIKTVIVLTEQNFDKSIKKGIVLVDFSTASAPLHEQLLTELATELGNVAVIAKVDLKQVRSKIRDYNIRNVPTFIIFKDGLPMTTFVGIRPKQVFADAINSIK